MKAKLLRVLLSACLAIMVAPARAQKAPEVGSVFPPGGKAGAAFAKLFGRDAATEIREDLRRFKQLVEAGEVPTNKGQPRG